MILLNCSTEHINTALGKINTLFGNNIFIYKLDSAKPNLHTLSLRVRNSAGLGAKTDSLGKRTIFISEVVKSAFIDELFILAPQLLVKERTADFKNKGWWDNKIINNEKIWL